MTTWNKEERVEAVDEMLIQYGRMVANINSPETADEVINARGKILQHIRSLIDLAEVSGELTGMRQKQ